MAESYDPAAPDIYVILLDGYPGDDAAELEPSFDANAFPEALAGARLRRPAPIEASDR